MSLYGGRRKAPIHEKSMGSYELFAWRDAMSMAEWIDEEFGVAHARKVYEQFDSSSVLKFERENQDLLANFIQKTESQRPAFLRRVAKKANEDTRILFVTLALIGVLRAKEVMEIRDSFRTALAPGRGNRVTTAGIYVFTEKIRDIFTYGWPWEPFDAMGIYCGEDEEGEENEERA